MSCLEHYVGPRLEDASGTPVAQRWRRGHPEIEALLQMLKYYNPYDKDAKKGTLIWHSGIENSNNNHTSD